MDRNQAKQLLPIIKAYAEGKTIQFYDSQIDIEDIEDIEDWEDCEYPDFDATRYKFRIKPEPTFRPFANAEECWNEMLKHQPFGWVKDRNGSKSVIENVDSRGFVEVFDDGTCNYGEVFDNRTFADGTPFGVKVE